MVTSNVTVSDLTIVNTSESAHDNIAVAVYNGALSAISRCVTSPSNSNRSCRFYLRTRRGRPTRCRASHTQRDAGQCPLRTNQTPAAKLGKGPLARDEGKTARGCIG